MRGDPATAIDIDANIDAAEIGRIEPDLETALAASCRDGDLKRAISTVCPGILFPYARAAVSQLVSQGGFPQFLLPPVNFDALYAANQTQPGQAN